MKVRMVTQMSGDRHDGRPWPGPRNTLDVTDEEGAALVHAGIAVPADEERKAEEKRPAADDPAVETRAEKPAASKPAGRKA